MFLRFTVFITGAVVMIVELLGTKIIAPFFGSTVYTWTALIAVTMVSLSAGYYLGGHVSDKLLSKDRLYWIILFSAVFLLVIPFLQFPVLKLGSKFGLRSGVLISSFILFSVPLLLLGMVSPFSVKLCYQDKARLGKTVGSLYAISTVGSLVGTILTGFFFIPHFGNLHILLGCSVTLILLSAFFFLAASGGKDRTIRGGIIVFLLVFAWIVGRYSHQNSVFVKDKFIYKVIDRANSNYGNLRIVDIAYAESPDAPFQRDLYNDGLCQNRIDLRTGKSLVPFSYALKGLIALTNPAPKTLLCIGTGAGILPMEFFEMGVEVDAVEINPQIHTMAKKYFNYSDSKAHTIEADGRYYLNSTEKKYDVVILDAFLGDSVPAHLLTIEMFRTIKSHLNQDGVLVVNFFGIRKNDMAVDALYTMLKKTFTHVNAYSKSEVKLTNIYFSASDKEPASRFVFSEGPPPFLAKILKDIFSHPLEMFYDETLILTDNKNPVEIWDLKNREEVRKRIQSFFLMDILA
ncbi:MAG: fused MFS/spermidine synthase [Candidatus Aureabacteria bacterium]|nr:fused MFS/spermidine synthase [Candidatus Auribacterota bacterium]